MFIYASNYLVHSYGIYAASAMAGNAVVRSFMGGTLPLAGPALYKALGPNWAGTLLGLLEVMIIPIPFAFYRYGHKIRAKSTLIREMREEEERQERKKKKAIERALREERRQAERERRWREIEGSSEHGADEDDTDGERATNDKVKENAAVTEKRIESTAGPSDTGQWKEKDMV